MLANSCLPADGHWARLQLNRVLLSEFTGLANEDGFGIGGNFFWLMPWITSMKVLFTRV